MPPRDLLRQIPSVDDLLRRPALADCWAALGPAGARHVIAAVLDGIRLAPTQGKLAALDNDLRAAAERRLQPSLRPVINATGVVLHTNLGRAPLSAAAVARVAEVAGSYSNLELDLATGQRGRRDRHLEALLAELTGAEASLVVNNNAAGVLLALNTLAVDLQGEILVSRGELVEIGESFRIPDIIARGGAKLVEVGSTNRTRLADYQRALTPRTRLVLRVHRSNFTMRGFVEQPALAALAAFAHQAGLPLVEDLGSGCLVAAPGLPPEPRVSDSIRAGVDLIAYSGDKLLGGPQAGLVSGRAALVARLRSNPLFRALRVDRLTYAALEATLAALARQAWEELPLFIMMAASGLEARVRAFAAQLPAALHAEILPGASLFGGGSAPGQSLPTWIIALAPEDVSAQRVADRLRLGHPPVVARLEQDRCLLDLRTVFPSQEPALLRALIQAAAAAQSSDRMPTSDPL